jgi:hypothetical protein
VIEPSLSKPSYILLLTQIETLQHLIKSESSCNMKEEDFGRLEQLVAITYVQGYGRNREYGPLKGGDGSEGTGGGSGGGQGGGGGSGGGEEVKDDDGFDWDWQPGVESPFLGYGVELTNNLEDMDWSWDGYAPWLPIGEVLT